jgi:hypothetical protein
MGGLLRRGTARDASFTRDDIASELTLLREENLRLRLERQRLIGVGRAVDHMREMSAVPDADDDAGDDAWQVLAQALALRDAVLDICGEVEKAMGNLRRQLDAYATRPLLHDSVVELRRGDGNLVDAFGYSAPPDETMEAETADAASS